VLIENGPILVVVSRTGDTANGLREGMRRRGHSKFIAWPLTANEVRHLYGEPFELVAASLSDEQPLRVLDFDGVRVFKNISLNRLDAEAAIAG
jgi:hypothetical protein